MLLNNLEKVLTLDPERAATLGDHMLALQDSPERSEVLSLFAQACRSFGFVEASDVIADALKGAGAPPDSDFRLMLRP